MTSDFRGASADAVATLTGELETSVSGSPEVATQIEDLVERSFLGPQARRDYLGIVADRRQALSIMHT